MEDFDHKYYHRTLASYYLNKSLYLDRTTQKNPNLRKLVEQPWQQVKSQLWNEVTDTLSNLLFVEGKIRAGLLNKLKDDYTISANELGKNEKERTNYLLLCAFQDFIICESNNLEKYINISGFLFQQLLNNANTIIANWAKTQGKIESIIFKLLFKKNDILRNAVTLNKHTKQVTGCTFNMKNNELLTCGFDGKIIVWDTLNWKLKGIKNDVTSAVTCVDLSEQNGRFIFGTGDGHIYTSSLESGNPTRHAFTFSKAPLSCKYADELDLIAAAGEKELVLIKASTGEINYKIDLQTRAYEISISKTGLIAIACHHGGLKIVESATGIIVRVLRVSEMVNFFSCAFSDDGSRLYVAGGNDIYMMDVKPYGLFTILDTSTWKEVPSCRHKVDSLAMSCLPFSEDFYAVGLYDGKLIIINSVTQDIVRIISAHDLFIRRIVLSPDYHSLVTASGDGSCKVWNVDDLKFSAGGTTLAGKGVFSGFSHDGKKGTVWLAETSNFNCDFYRTDFEFGNEKGGLIVSKCDVNYFLEQNLKMITHDHICPKTVTIINGSEMSYQNDICTSPFSGPWNYYLIGCSARLYPFTFHLLPELPLELSKIRKITWNKSKKDYYALLQPEKILIYDASSTLFIDIPFTHENQFPDNEAICKFSRDSGLLFFTNYKSFYLLNILQKRLHEFDLSPCSVISICESLDGKKVLLGCNDCTIKQFDLVSFQITKEFKGHEHIVADCCYLNENYFISISLDKTMRIWNDDRTDCIAVFVSENKLTTFSLYPSERSIIASDIHGNIYPLTIVDIHNAIRYNRPDIIEIKKLCLMNEFKNILSECSIAEYLEVELFTFKSMENAFIMMKFIAHLLLYYDRNKAYEFNETAAVISSNFNTTLVHELLSYPLSEIYYVTLEVSNKEYTPGEQVKESIQLIRSTARIINALHFDRSETAFDIAKRYTLPKFKNILLLCIYEYSRGKYSENFLETIEKELI